MARRGQEFQTIRSEGGLLPPDILRRVLDPRGGLAGTAPQDFGLPAGDRLNEVITQSWSRLLRHWSDFRETASRLPDGEAGTGLTNDRWNLPLLRELGYGLLPTGAGPEISGRTYAISRFFGPVPIHLIGCGLSLDHRARGQRGAAASNPHGLVQDFLNRSDEHLWALLSNGLRLRLLRDNLALSRQSYLEFDLEAMLDGEVFSDFALLWLTAHATRLIPPDGEHPDSCWLEQWTKEAEEQGTRALGDLRGGVQRALQALGEGFTSHPRNTELREALRSGTLPPVEFHAQLLRVVYRLIFLFVAEDRTLDGRPLLHPPGEDAEARLARDRYSAHYSMGRLREMAGRIKGGRHGDLWRQFQLLVGALSGAKEHEMTRAQLALPALGSFLWASDSTVSLNDTDLTNHDLLEAVRNLGFTRPNRVLRPVDYKNLGAEELGGVYESLLALTPKVSADGALFTFAELAGNERKTSGSYYTPDVLVQCLLDSALDPVVAAAIEGKSGDDAAQAILALRVCDPAVGSGHFLVGAAHRLARHLARTRALEGGENEPSPLEYQHALREVIGHCLYGVDINPMAAELCRVGLWLEALEPGKPLSFLDNHIMVGNSLLGSGLNPLVPDLPDAALAPVFGDDTDYSRALQKRNKQERVSSQAFLGLSESDTGLDPVVALSTTIDGASEDTLAEVELKASMFQDMTRSAEYRRAATLADAWCAAYFWPRNPGQVDPITTATLWRLMNDADGLSEGQSRMVRDLAEQYKFFHWPLSFPEVFSGTGGFDVVLGNPPWDRVKLQEQEFFQTLMPQIATAGSASKRTKLISELFGPEADESEKRVAELYTQARKASEGTALFLRASGHYPDCSVGDQNLYAVFTELSCGLIGREGRTGFIVQSDIATGATYRKFFGRLVSDRRLISFHDFVNTERLFPGLDTRNPHFCLITVQAKEKAGDPLFSFWNTNADQLRDDDRQYTLSAEDFSLVNPSTKTCPVFRTRIDADIVRKIYATTGILGDGQVASQQSWGTKLWRGFDKSTESSLLMTRETLEGAGCYLDGNVFVGESERFVPVWEGSGGHQFNHRYSSFENGQWRELTDVELSDPACHVLPAYWADEQVVARRFTREEARCSTAMLGHRRVSNSTNERTVIATILPPGGTTYGWILTSGGDASDLAVLCALYNSVVFDFCLRNKLTQPSIPQILFSQNPCLQPSQVEANRQFILERVIELVFTSSDLSAFASECGYSSPPFRWNVERRLHVRAEIDALVGLASGLSREDMEHIMLSFGRWRHLQKRKFGAFRSFELTLSAYEQLSDTANPV